MVDLKSLSAESGCFLDFVRKKRTYTKRLAHKTIQEVLKNDIHSIASKGIVTTEEIERM